MSEDPVSPKVVYWRRDLPPLRDESIGEQEVQARSASVALSSVEHDQLWADCYPNLLQAASERITQEVLRLHGSCAHVLDEKIEAKTSYATGEYWLEGRFTYVLYVHPAA